MTRRAAKRSRAPFDLDALIDLGNLSTTTAAEEDDLAAVLSRAPRTTRRNLRRLTKRAKRPGRKNFRLSTLQLAVALLRTPAFFDMVELIRLPEARSGPPVTYSPISVLLWECLIEDFGSFREAEVSFRDPLIWNFLRTVLRETWPDAPDRRLPKDPMSRHQFHRHRRRLQQLRPDVHREILEEAARSAKTQAIAAGYFAAQPSSLAHPHRNNIVWGDGTFYNARFDAIEGDKSEDHVTGEIAQVRFDPDARLGIDRNDKVNPGYRWVITGTDPMAEQEGVILNIGLARDGGETPVLEHLLGQLDDVPGARHFGYDMAVQGAFADSQYRRGRHPITKLPRNSKGEPANGLLEVRTFRLADGTELPVQIYGVDGVCMITAVADGRRVPIPLEPVALRDRPSRRVYGEYRIPDHPAVDVRLRGLTVQVRMDGETRLGRKRAQYLRWINEHTAVGGALLGRRSTTESSNSIVERSLDGGRARSAGAFNNTLDMVGLMFGRNLRAALAHERRTGSDPLGLRPPPPIAHQALSA